jgi:hypothetical protein
MNADQLAVNSPATSPRPDGAPTLRIRAVMLGERINPSGLEMGATVSSMPAAFRVHAGLAVIFRYGVVVLIGLLPSEEKVLIDSLKPRVIGEFSPTRRRSRMRNSARTKAPRLSSRAARSVSPNSPTTGCC